MKINIAFLPAMGLGILVLAGAASAQSTAAQAPAPAAATPVATSPGKVAVIDIQAALIQTKDGQKAANELKAKFSPKQDELTKKQNDIAQLQTQLRNGSNTMTEEAKQKLMRDIDSKNVSLKRETEDAEADVQQEQQRIMNDLGGKMISVLNKFATENGYALVLDISSQQTPVLFASNTIDITRDIIALYDKAAPTMTSPSAAPQRPSSGITNAPRPATPAPTTPKKP